MSSCDHYRRVGNCFFREGQWARAIDRYKRSLIYYEYAFPDAEEDQRTMDKIRCVCLLNIAACNVRMRQWDEVISHASQALSMTAGLDIDQERNGGEDDGHPHSVTGNALASNNDSESSSAWRAKAYYRRAVAHRHRGDFDEASSDLAAALRHAPGDDAVLRELALLKRHQLAYKRKQQTMARAMMTGGGANNRAVADNMLAAPAAGPTAHADDTVEDDAASATSEASDLSLQLSELSLADLDNAHDAGNGAEELAHPITDGIAAPVDGTKPFAKLLQKRQLGLAPPGSTSMLLQL